MLFLATVIWNQPLWAAPKGADASEMAALFEVPCRELGIPRPLALAIAKVESGLHPWSLNIEGQSFRFGSKAATLLKAEEARTAGRSFDTGLMQINDWWLKKYGLSPETVLDPLANIYLGGWILKQELARHGGDVRAAVGAYHSPHPARADRYAQQVLRAVHGDSPQPAVPRTAPDQTAASPLLVTSARKTLAQSHSMKAAATAAHDSMKVHP
jgi:hypothetical protein